MSSVSSCEPFITITIIIIHPLNFYISFSVCIFFSSFRCRSVGPHTFLCWFPFWLLCQLKTVVTCVTVTKNGKCDCVWSVNVNITTFCISLNTQMERCFYYSLFSISLLAERKKKLSHIKGQSDDASRGGRKNIFTCTSSFILIQKERGPLKVPFLLFKMLYAQCSSIVNFTTTSLAVFVLNSM